MNMAEKMYNESEQLRSFGRMDSSEVRQDGRSLDDRSLKELGGDKGKVSVEELRATMPKRRKHLINQKLVDDLNKMIDDPEIRNQFRDNLLGYADVMRDPRVTLTNYVHAVKFVSFKMLGHTNQESWIRTFPKRYNRLMKEGKSAEYMRSLISQYNRGKVVNQIMEQSLVPTWVLNHDKYQLAINEQAKLMLTAKSEKVRSDAANSLLTHLKQPETTKVSLDVNIKEDDSIKELREATLELARQQRLSIQAGASNAKAIAESKIIDASQDQYSEVEKDW